MAEEKCPICDHDKAEMYRLSDSSDRRKVKCDYCGEFIISRTLQLTASRNFDQFGERFYYSGILRNRFEEGIKTEIHKNNIKKLPDSVFIPENPIQTIDHLLKVISKEAKRPSEKIYFDRRTDFPLLFAKNQDEFEFYLNNAVQQGLVVPPQHSDDGHMLSLTGWQRLEQLQTDLNNNQAFVAMWFDESLNELWRNGFKEGLEECGLQPIRIDLEEHNEKICDKIIAEIRNSRILVADFTGQRGGVYFEAGFAMGLDMPVIWTCRSNDIDNVHSDTRQYNHIVWEGYGDLKTKLINRVNATVLI
jgi:hypothetical protein